jgi:hypothetical protein
MKTILMFLLGFACVLEVGRSQTNEVGVAKTPPVPAEVNSNYKVSYQTNVPYPRRLGELQVTYGGVVQEVKQGGMRRLLEPAPANGPAKPFQNVSVNPRTGRAEGVILFSINF